jgi:aspartyl-tRNA(Asn)/glutamyl-tRNA(Gln) amidotransferase subunit C
MIGKQDIEKLSNLARIHISEEEKESLAKEIDSILAYVAQIDEASTSAIRDENYQRNVMRDDNNAHESGVFTETLLKAAPGKEGQYFKVKKILGGQSQ